MKDMTGRELRKGDLVLDIRTEYGWHSLAIVEGSETASGNPRILQLWKGKKTHTKYRCLVKISLELFNEIYNEKFAANLENDALNAASAIETGYSIIMNLYKETHKE